MKLRALGLAAMAAMAMTAFTAGTASATTLEVGGVKQNGAVAMEMSLKPGASLMTSRTDGSLANTCNESTMKGTTNAFTGATVTGPVSSLSFTVCERPFTVHKPGTLHFAHIAGSTDATVTSSAGEWTVGSPFGTLNCKTGAGVHLGRLTGTDGTPATHAELDINAVINCGFLMPSALLQGTYVVTSPTKLGVSA